jgi:hypothetical protein
LGAGRRRARAARARSRTRDEATHAVVPVVYVEWVSRRDGRTNRSTRGEVLYGYGLVYVLRAGIVLLVAMVGAIVLTLKVRTQSRAKRQQAHQQRARDADRAVRRVAK